MESNKVLQHAMIRIYHKRNQLLLFEDYIKSNQDGTSEIITLFIEPTFNDNETINHYITYLIDIHLAGYESIIAKPFHLFVRETCYLPIYLKKVHL
ncbi:MAG: hypothetical protein RR673_08980 [Erysipelotrichaceae bacterium]